MSEQPTAGPIRFAPFIENAVLTVDGTDVSIEVENVRWSSTNSATWNPVSGHTITAADGWTLSCRYGEDWEDPASFANFVYDHEGETVPCTFKPKGAGVVVWKCEVTLAFLGLGGPRGVAATDASFGSTKPIREVVSA